MSTDRLVKSKAKVWSGVLGGIAEHFDEDPALIRILYCIITLFSGFLCGLIVYWILAICIPERG